MTEIEQAIAAFERSQKVRDEGIRSAFEKCAAATDRLTESVTELMTRQAQLIESLAEQAQQINEDRAESAETLGLSDDEYQMFKATLQTARNG
jgi:uncharacterized membrane-anchored protein YhcB (DUF1043 family)